MSTPREREILAKEAERTKKEREAPSTGKWSPTDLHVGGVIPGPLESKSFHCGLDFHKEGNFLVVTTSDAAVHLIDAFSGQPKRKVYTKTCGWGDVKFTHNEDSVLLTASAPGEKEREVHYLSLYDNRYLRHFGGHSQRVLSISMCPISDNFLSSSLDRTVCLWDIRKAGGATGRIQLPSNVLKPTVQYEGAGVIFAVMGQEEHSRVRGIKLFESRMGTEPFMDIAPTNEQLEAALFKAQPGLQRSQISKIMAAPWTGMEFSPDGLSVLVSTQGEAVFVLDSGLAQNKPPLALMRKNEAGLALGACFSADAKCVLAGNDENEIMIWSCRDDEGVLQNTLSGPVAPVTHIRANPKYDLIASSCLNTALWIHDSSNSNLQQMDTSN